MVVDLPLPDGYRRMWWVWGDYMDRIRQVEAELFAGSWHEVRNGKMDRMRHLPRRYLFETEDAALDAAIAIARREKVSADRRLKKLLARQADKEPQT